MFIISFCAILESAISEQLFCNDKVNPNNEPCYGISTVSGLQRAAQQGQKIYQIDSKNRDQLKNIAMSDENMANDINKAIDSGGYVIVPEKAVDGAGRNAVYVHMTYNGQDGYQSWKISGGLNGAEMGIAIGISLGYSFASLLKSKGKSSKTLALIFNNPATLLSMSFIVGHLAGLILIDLVQGRSDQKINTANCFLTGVIKGFGVATTTFLDSTSHKNIILQNIMRVLRASVAITTQYIDDYVDIPSIRECGI